MNWPWSELDPGMPPLSVYLDVSQSIARKCIGEPRLCAPQKVLNCEYVLMYSL